MNLLPLMLLLIVMVLGFASWFVLGTLTTQTTQVRMARATVSTRPLRLSRRRS